MIFYLSFKIFLFINYCKVSELLRKVWRSDQKLSNYEIFALLEQKLRTEKKNLNFSPNKLKF